MSDDLRTRIAAVLYRLYSHGSWEQLLEIERQAWGDDADAVIRELEPELNRHDTGCVCDDCWPDQEGD